MYNNGNKTPENVGVKTIKSQEFEEAKITLFVYIWKWHTEKNVEWKKHEKFDWWDDGSLTRVSFFGGAKEAVDR